MLEKTRSARTEDNVLEGEYLPREQDLVFSPPFTEMELAACGGCDGYECTHPHQRINGQVKIKCSYVNDMVSVHQGSKFDCRSYPKDNSYPHLRHKR